MLYLCSPGCLCAFKVKKSDMAEGDTMDQTATRDPVSQGDALGRQLLPLALEVQDDPWGFLTGKRFTVTLHSGLTVLIGPNGSGKTRLLRLLKGPIEASLGDARRQRPGRASTLFLAAGRSAPFEQFRASVLSPGHVSTDPADIGHSSYIDDSDLI
jgi:hypothetical protein